MQLVLATANPDKVREIEKIFVGFELVARPKGVPDVIEDADTLYGNALLKAQALCLATGVPSVADDTGLEVDALDGRPGVKSARFAGPNATYADNVRLLLTEMHLVPDACRTARFRTVALASFPDGKIVWAEGAVEGVIATEPMGQGGFGYDPVFVPTEGSGAGLAAAGPAAATPSAAGTTARSFAQMTVEEKNAISHRGRAFALLAQRLNGALAE